MMVIGLSRSEARDTRAKIAQAAEIKHANVCVWGGEKPFYLRLQIKRIHITFQIIRFVLLYSFIHFVTDEMAFIAKHRATNNTVARPI